MRRALVLLIVLFAFLIPSPAARAANTVTISITTGSPSPNPANLTPGDKVKWHSNDVAYKIHAEGFDIEVPAGGDSSVQGPFDAGTYDYAVRDSAGTATVGSGQIVAEAPTTTTTTATTRPTTTTKSTTTTSSSTTTSTSDTTTTSSSTTTTAPNSSFSNFSGPIAVQDKGGNGGSSSALPLLLGAFVVVAGLAGLAYWMWTRSGERSDDEGPDWTQEPPPTVQGPRI